MRQFRIVPPIFRSDEEVDIDDEEFLDRAKKFSEHELRKINGVATIASTTSGRGIRIYRLEIKSSENELGTSGGVLLYWEYINEDRSPESQFHFGKSLGIAGTQH